ncbi:MAG: phosphonate C-P lyase system protein PhnG [Thermodesulfobacteriota bacterium]
MRALDETASVAYMEDSDVEALLDLFSGEEMIVTRPPRTGLAMVTAVDGFSTQFHLGEMLVTEAAVSFRGTEGYGMVAGDSPEKALARAAADAVLRGNAGGPLRKTVADFLESARERRGEGLRAEAALGASTRVSFDLVAGK